MSRDHRDFIANQLARSHLIVTLRYLYCILILVTVCQLLLEVMIPFLFNFRQNDVFWALLFERKNIINYDSKVSANSINPDQTAHKEQSDHGQGIFCPSLGAE